ncbi:MAG: hypothetical protein K0S74_1726 [Chlamydiales bacterium]|jgi:hypothetical protein|nr:hypothetical protein [Chlamydiales bacterium]
MKRYLTLFILFFTLQVENSLQGSITPVKQLSQIEPYLKEADVDTLVIFDVDYTLIAARDLFGRPKAHQARKTAYAYFKEKHGSERLEHLFSLLLLNIPNFLIEPSAKVIIDELHQRKIPVIALTAISNQPVGGLSNPLEWRIQDLKNLGLNFSFHDLPLITWGDDSAAGQGVILSGKQSKGLALLHFLEQIPWQPKTIIFIDDGLNYLKSMEQVCLEKEIKFIGFQYLSESFDQDPEPMVEVIKLQLDTLNQTRVWLDYTVAEQMLVQTQ